MLHWLSIALNVGIFVQTQREIYSMDRQLFICHFQQAFILRKKRNDQNQCVKFLLFAFAKMFNNLGWLVLLSFFFWGGSMECVAHQLQIAHANCLPSPCVRACAPS